MSQSISFNIYVLSYKRPNVNLTGKLLDYCTYVVREVEAEEYRKNGHQNLLVIPKERPCYNFMDTFYWTIRNTPEDVIAIIDDDIRSFRYRTDINTKIDCNEEGKIIATNEIERIAQLLVDLDLGLAFDSINGANYAYRGAFRFIGMPGHLRWVNKKCFKAVYDYKDPASSDVDMMFQELMYNRIILSEWYFHLYSPVEKAIGEKEIRESSEHKAFVHAIKNKWGKYYGYDFTKNEARINVQR